MIVLFKPLARAALVAATLFPLFAVTSHADAEPGVADKPPSAETGECAWVGERILSLLWRDDINTARNFLELYKQFGCPMERVGLSFRCLVAIGVMPEETEPGLPERAKACWADPNLDPAALIAPLPPQQGNGSEEKEPAEAPQEGSGKTQ